MRKLLLAVTAAFALLTGGLALAPAASAAPAVPSVTFPELRLFEAYGQFAIGAPTVASGRAVMETASGRDLYVPSQYVNGNGDTVVKIQFAIDRTLCVVNPGSFSTVGSCSGTGSLWTLHAAGCSNCWRFENNYQSSQLGFSVYLTGQNNGSQFYISGYSAPGYKVFQVQNP